MFWMFLSKLSKEPMLLTIPTKNLDGVIGESTIPIQLPHAVLEYLLGQCGLSLADETVIHFWRHMEEVGDTWALATRDYRAASPRLVWTLGLYGDEACMQINNAPFDKIIGIYLNIPLFRPKSTRLSRFLLCSIESVKVISARETFYPILQAIVQSCNQVAEEGVLGRRFLVSELRGDQAWIRFLFSHVSWWKATNVCFRCKACSGPGDLNYLRNDSENGWESTIRSTNDFLMQELPEVLCTLPRHAISESALSKVLMWTCTTLTSV